MIQFACPQCVELISVPDTFAGQDGRCKHCGAAIQVPQAPGHSNAGLTAAGSDASQTLWTQIHEGPPAIRYGAVVLAWALVFSLILLNRPGSPVPSAEEKVRGDWANWQRQSKTFPHIHKSDIVHLDILDEFLFKGQATVWIRSSHADGTYRNHQVTLIREAGQWKADRIHWFDKIQRFPEETAYYPDEERGGDFEVFQGKQQYAWTALFNDPKPSNRMRALSSASQHPEILNRCLGAIIQLLDDPDSNVSQFAYRVIGRQTAFNLTMIQALRTELGRTSSKKVRGFLLQKLLLPTVDARTRKEVTQEALKNAQLRPHLFEVFHLVRLNKSDSLKLLEYAIELFPGRKESHNDPIRRLVQRMNREKVEAGAIQDILMKHVGKADKDLEARILSHLRELGSVKPAHVRKLFPMAIRDRKNRNSQLALNLLQASSKQSAATLLELICAELAKGKAASQRDRPIALLLNRLNRSMPPFSRTQLDAALTNRTQRSLDLIEAILIHAKRGPLTTKHLLGTLDFLKKGRHKTNYLVAKVWDAQKSIEKAAFDGLFQLCLKDSYFNGLFTPELVRLCPISIAAPYFRKGLKDKKSIVGTLALVAAFGKKAKMMLPELRTLYKNCQDYKLRKSIDTTIRIVS